MRTGYAFLAVISLSLIQCASAIFCLKDKWVGQDFLYGGWDWETENDPTHGRVNYVDEASAISDGLAYGTFFFCSSPRAIRVIESNFSGGQSVLYACGRLVYR